jgi:hypothetical protein
VKVTRAFLAAAERLARNTIAANAEAKTSEMEPGTTVLLVQPENQLAMVERIRLLEQLLDGAACTLEASTDKTYRREVAANIREQMMFEDEAAS